ncbi:hypothetical protein D3Z36_09320 [Lachnospiraceae bacterium]|nr:hypothetical protein [Lachnospiraceae bacterium]
MKGFRKCIGAITAAALFVTALPLQGMGVSYAAGEAETAADIKVSIQPQAASKFHDTDGDGWGEFEGFGTSLCWWANRLGYSEKMTQQAAELFFSENGLHMNIGRYNVGGGDHTLAANEKAQFYDLETNGRKPSYAGSKMVITDQTGLKDALYTVSDADFGIIRGSKVGQFKYIGYINALDGEVGSGDNLHFTVNVKEAGNYTVKLILMHNNDSTRNVAIRVNPEMIAEGSDTAQVHIIDNAQIQQGKMIEATGSNQALFRVTIPNVQLKAGDNKIQVAGSGAWTLDFVKMAVIKAGEEGVLQEGEDEFLHSSHIKRSDSVVPGYCVDVTKIDTSEKTIEQYQEEFTRVDEECGYAWNYDWDADRNQMNILKAAANAGGQDFIAEAFSNSPPYFMTNSGCSSGASDASKDNLRADSYHAFASYMADVIVHWTENGITFQSTSPMNEPDTNYWGANSNKQEGCHFDPGDSQSRIITALYNELKTRAEAATDANVKSALENIIFSGTDETDIDKAITSYNKLSEEARKAVTRIDTHTYSGSKREELRALAEQEGKNLWMSEVDGSYSAGANAGEMSAALGLAQQIIKDLNGLKASAWILWNAVDINVDASHPFDHNTVEEAISNKNAGYWGLAIGDHNNEEIVLTKKYEAFGQFSRYIRPGYTIIGSDSGNTLAAWDRENKKLVIVAVNDQSSDARWKFDLSKFTSVDAAKLGNISAYRTSGSMESGEKWLDVSENVNAAADAGKKCVTADMKANSITTFIIEGVEEYDPQQDYAGAEEKIYQKLLEQNTEFIEQNMEEVSLNASMVTGSKPWTNKDGVESTDVVTNVVDGNYDTFFDGVADGWVQIDMGKQENLAAVAYAPRKSYADRCTGASFYGSNDGQNWTRLYTIVGTPKEGTCTNVYATAFASPAAAYRYVKYAVPQGDSSANCNIAEIKLYRMKAGVTVPEIVLPDSLEGWMAYYQEKMEGHKYSADTKKVFDEAMAAANAAADDAAQKKARKMLADAYLALEEIFTYDSISGVEGAVLRDNNGKVIQAHGGQIQQLTVGGVKKYYWIGEDKTNDYRPCPGIHMYTSTDLYNWTDEGLVLKTAKTFEEFTTDEYFTSLYGDLTTEAEQKRIFTDIWQGENSAEGCVIERPKMLYNDKTGKYVIWFHADGQDPFAAESTGNYAKAKAGVAIADSPTGPYKLLGSYLLNTDVTLDKHGFDGDVGGHVRDMNLFKDDDGTAYVMYSSDGNENMYIARLNEEYTNVAEPDNTKAQKGVGKDFTLNFKGESREAPAMFKYRDKYYMITSGCTGWAPNPARYAVADHPMGPFQMVGDPCTDQGAQTTYDTQSTCVFPVGDPAEGKFIYMGDRWNTADTGSSLRDSRYVWLPVEFIDHGAQIALRRYADWKLDILGELQIDTKLPETAASVKELKEKLPDTIDITIGGQKQQGVLAEWSGFPQTETLGDVTLTAVLQNGRKISHTAYIVNNKMIYFFDCARDSSEYLEAAKKITDKIRNTAADQAYSAENRAGYAGALGTDFKVRDAKSAGTINMWSTGYWAEKGKNIDYAFDLEAGSYTVAAGYQEWWGSSTASRPMKITARSDNKELAAQTFDLAKSSGMQQEIKFTLEKDAKVTVSNSKTGGSDPVLSWIAVIQNTGTETPEDPEDPVDPEEPEDPEDPEEPEDPEDPVIINKEALNETIRKAELLNEKDYLAESFSSFKEVFESAVSIQENPDASQDDVDEANTMLSQAMETLKTKTVKKYLEDEIKKYTVPENQKDEYTPASWEFYAQKLQDAQTLINSEDLTEEAAKSAVSALEAAKMGLEPAGEVETPADKEALNETIRKAELLNEKDYLAENWSILKDALAYARGVQQDPQAAQTDVDAANARLIQAMEALETKTVKKYLEEAIVQYTIPENQKDQYTSASWELYVQKLQAVKDLLNSEGVTETAVKSAISALEAAKAALQPAGPAGTIPQQKEEQALVFTKEYTKKLGDKPFALNISGAQGALSYQVSDSRVAVMKNGKINLKGTGICTITVTAAATDHYNAKSVTVMIKVSPKKAVLNSVKAIKGTKLTVKWKKDTKASGYEVQYCLKKNFKSGVKKADIKKSKTSSKTIKKGLKKNKRYYVRIRAYKKVKVNQKFTKLYGPWSKVRRSGKVK